MATLCRVEGWSGRGWVILHAGIALIDPEKYVATAEKRLNQIPLRVIELDDRLQPSDRVWQPEGWDLL